MKKFRPSLTRHEVCYLMDGLEAMIEEIKHWEGEAYTEDYAKLLEKFHSMLRRHDLGRKSS